MQLRRLACQKTSNRPLSTGLPVAGLDNGLGASANVNSWGSPALSIAVRPNKQEAKSRTLMRPF